MGTGKTSVGKRLAHDLGMKFLDTDELIESEAGMKIALIFESHGEPYFRSLEKQVVKKLIEGRFGEGIVLSTGGGLIVDKENRDALKKWGALVCLKASVDAILARVGKGENRPLLSGPDREKRIAELISLRQSAYDECEITVDTTSLSVTEVKEKIEEFLSGIGFKGNNKNP